MSCIAIRSSTACRARCWLLAERTMEGKHWRSSLWCWAPPWGGQRVNKRAFSRAGSGARTRTVMKRRLRLPFHCSNPVSRSCLSWGIFVKRRWAFFRTFCNKFCVKASASEAMLRLGLLGIKLMPRRLAATVMPIICFGYCWH